MRRFTLFVLSLVVAGAAPPLDAWAAPSFTPLAVSQPDQQARPTAISNDGTRVAGYLYVNDSRYYPPERTIGAAWDAAGQVTPLGDVPGGDMAGVANAISGDGSIVVGTGVSYLRTEALRWNTNGEMERLHLLSGNGHTFQDSQATAISADGTKLFGNALHNGLLNASAVRWDDNGDIQLLAPVSELSTTSRVNDVSDDGGTVVGWIRENAVTSAFVWDEANGMQPVGELAELPGASSWAYAISGDGARIVGRSSQPGESIAWIWDQAGGIQALYGPVDGVSFLPHDISEEGSTVVGSGVVNGKTEAIVWDEEIGARTLKQILDASGVDTSGWDLREVNAVSANGLTIAGTGYDPGGRFTGFIAVIPEPGTGLLIAVGLFGLARRRRC